MVDKISRRSLLEAFLAGSISPGFSLYGDFPAKSRSSKTSKPNVVAILADDLGYGDLSSYGCPYISSDNIDRIAREGVKFTQFYVSCPVCSPTRASFLTGRYQQRYGLANYLSARSKDRGLSLKERLLSEYLKEAGYDTGLVGKWHLGYEKEYSPLSRGFDEFYGLLGGGMDYYTHRDSLGELDLHRGDRVLDDEGYITELISKEAVNFLDRHKSQPFFLLVSYTSPHTPYQPPGDSPADRRPSFPDGEEGKTARRAAYIRMVECMDKGVGDIVTRIGEHRIEENTLVVFFSDNGGQMAGRNFPLRDEKGTLFEGGIRVPCVMKWPGRIPEGKTIDVPVTNMDLFPTILHAARVRDPQDRIIDGKDLIPVIDGYIQERHEYLCWKFEYLDGVAIRKGDWKYHRDKNGREFLHNLSTDIGEEHNLIEKYPEKVAELKELVLLWEERVER